MTTAPSLAFRLAHRLVVIQSAKLISPRFSYIKWKLGMPSSIRPSAQDPIEKSGASPNWNVIKTPSVDGGGDRLVVDRTHVLIILLFIPRHTPSVHSHRAPHSPCRPNIISSLGHHRQTIYRRHRAWNDILRRIVVVV